MKMKTFIAAAVAGAFAAPIAIQAKDMSSVADSFILAQAGTPPAATTPPPGGRVDEREGASKENESRTPSTGASGAATGGAAGATTAPLSSERATQPPPGGRLDEREGATPRAGAEPGAGATAGASAAIFDRLDTNRDGYVSREEARAHTELSNQFSNLDKDGDGRLSQSEMGGWDASTGASGSAAGATVPSTTSGAGASAPGSAADTPRATTPPPGGTADVREGAVKDTEKPR